MVPQINCARPLVVPLYVMKKTRLALSEPLTEALAALARIEGRAVTHIVEHLLREQLKEMGVLKPPTAAEVEAAKAQAAKEKPLPRSAADAPAVKNGGARAARASSRKNTNERDRKHA
jgi:hypothetical protein